MTSVVTRTLMAVLAILAATATTAADLKPNRVDIQYMPPKSSDYESLYKRVQERRRLEIIRHMLAPLRLPRRVLLRLRAATDRSMPGTTMAPLPCVTNFWPGFCRRLPNRRRQMA